MFPKMMFLLCGKLCCANIEEGIQFLRHLNTTVFFCYIEYDEYKKADA